MIDSIPRKELWAKYRVYSNAITPNIGHTNGLIAHNLSRELLDELLHLICTDVGSFQEPLGIDREDTEQKKTDAV
jgi:hypothetical protein